MWHGVYSAGHFGPGLGAALNGFGPALNPHHNPHHNPHQNPHHNPHFNPHQNPHHNPHHNPHRLWWPCNGQADPSALSGSRYDPDPIGGDDSLISPDPYASGASTAQRRALSYDLATASPWPWRGVDPTWTYTGGVDALMGQALRKVRARLVGERDLRRTPINVDRPEQVTLPAPEDKPIWRWHSEFRQKAVVAELMGRSLVIGGDVLILNPQGAGAQTTVAPSLLFSIAPMENPFPYETQIDKVLRAASEREERLPEILGQAADFRQFFYSLTGLDRAPMPHVDELIQVAWDWATYVVMMLKNNLAEYRPVQRSSLVMPIIATPGHGSLPSGHATIASMTHHLLSALLYGQKDSRIELLYRLAARIAFNRVVAGVHFQMDSYVGRFLGAQLALALVNMSREKPEPFQSASVEVDADSQWAEDDAYEPPNWGTDMVKVPPVDSMRTLWTAALYEIQQMRI
jgi:hypothetical protein